MKESTPRSLAIAQAGDRPSRWRRRDPRSPNVELASCAAVAAGFIVAACVLIAGADPAAAEAEFFANHGDFLRSAHGPQAPFGIHVAHYHDVKLDDTDDRTDSEFDMTTLDLGRKWTVPLSPDTGALIGFRFGMRDYHGSGLDDTFFEIVPTFGITWFSSANLQLTAMFEPGLYSDLEGDTDSDDFRFHGSLMATYRVTPVFYLKGGAAANDDFKGIPVIPVGGFAWIPHPDIRFDVLAPQKAVVRWNPKAGPLTFHTGVFLQTARYLNHRSGRETHLRYQDIRVEGGVRIDLASRISVSLTGGKIVGGKYSIAGDESDQESEFFLHAGIGFRF